MHFSGYILAFTGPSGVGKSTVSRLLLKTSHHLLSPVPILTTRQPKVGDEGEYVHVSMEEFAWLRAQGALAASVDLPSRSEIRCYGYREADIRAIWAEHKIPLVITEMHLLQGLAGHFGRRSILSFGLLPPGRSKRMMLSHLLFRLRARGRETEEQIQDRLKNAEEDLAFFRARRDLFNELLVNDHLPRVVASLQGTVLKHAVEAA